MGSDRLRVEGLCKYYETEAAVEDLSLTIADGEFKSLLGPSGCGKTTTLRCIAGIETASAGRIYIDDELVSAPDQNVHVKPENRDIGMVFQSYAIWPHMTVKENVQFPLKVQGIGTKEDREAKVDEVLEMVGLSTYANSPATELSGGQQQRVAISRALVVEPKLLLFDEPLSNLDAKLRREMREEIKELSDELEIPTLYVTHSQDEAMFLSDSIALMNDGSIVEQNAPEALHTTPDNLFAMDFMGHTNHLRGRVEAREDGTVTVATPIDSFTVDTEWIAGGVGIGDEVVLSFRPKFCEYLGDGRDRDPTHAAVLEGTIEMDVSTRDFTEYHLAIDDATVVFRCLEPIGKSRGDRVRIAVPRRHVRLFPYQDQGALPEIIQ